MPVSLQAFLRQPQARAWPHLYDHEILKLHLLIDKLLSWSDEMLELLAHFLDHQAILKIDATVYLNQLWARPVVGLLSVLINKFADPNHLFTDKPLVFHMLEHGITKDVFDQLASLEIGLGACDSAGRTVLHMAATSGSSALLDGLYARGLAPLALDSLGRTPLHHAVLEGSAATINYLIRKSPILLNQFSNLKETALSLCVARPEPEARFLCMALVHAGARINGFYGECVLYAAIEAGAHWILGFLFDQGLASRYKVLAGQPQAQAEARLQQAQLALQKAPAEENLLQQLKASTQTLALIQANTYLEDKGRARAFHLALERRFTHQDNRVCLNASTRLWDNFCASPDPNMARALEIRVLPYVNFCLLHYHQFVRLGSESVSPPRSVDASVQFCSCLKRHDKRRRFYFKRPSSNHKIS